MKSAWARTGTRARYTRAIQKSRRTKESRLRTSEITRSLWKKKSYRRRQDAANPIRRRFVLQTNRNFRKTSKIQTSIFRSLCARRVRGIRLEYQEFPYLIDIASPRRKIAVEVDGRYWHTLPSCKKKDKAKTLHLRRRGWKVYRIPAENPFRDSAIFLAGVLR